MLFQSTPFLFVFLPVTLIIFYILRHYGRLQASLGFLTLASIFFYAIHYPPHFLLLACSIVANFFMGRRLARCPSKGLLATGVAFNLSILLFFKYAGFILFNINVLTGTNYPNPGIILPLAISFFTFQKIAYLVDVYRGGAPKYTFTEFALFVLFFPQLIAGPIVHHGQFMPQARKLASHTPDLGKAFAMGSFLLSVGLFKKICLADPAGLIADRVFFQAGHGIGLDMISAWVGTITFALQIYFDFSGYSDMAIGLASMFGFRLPINFRSPYRATSIIDFWRRWHITLSQFLRDYLYIPLGGNRLGIPRSYLNIMIVMLLGGFWHGASWNFCVWGGLHGLYLVINHLWRKGPFTLWGGDVLSWSMTLIAVLVAWVFFRAPDLQSALGLVTSLTGLNGIVIPGAIIHAMPFLNTLGITDGSLGNLILGIPTVQLLAIPVGLIVAVALPNVYDMLGRHWHDDMPLQTRSRFSLMHLHLTWTPTLGYACLGAAFFILSMIGRWQTTTFLYFQF